MSEAISLTVAVGFMFSGLLRSLSGDVDEATLNIAWACLVYLTAIYSRQDREWQCTIQQGKDTDDE